MENIKNRLEYDRIKDIVTYLYELEDENMSLKWSKSISKIKNPDAKITSRIQLSDGDAYKSYAINISKKEGFNNNTIDILELFIEACRRLEASNYVVYINSVDITSSINKNIKMLVIHKDDLIPFEYIFLPDKHIPYFTK